MSAYSMKVLGTAKKPQRYLDATEDFQEWESHLIVRFPTEVAERVKKMLEEETRANDMFTLNFGQDMRSGTVRFDQQNYPFKLHDLPTITEVMKTLDNKTVFKVADLCQMIVCSTSTNEASNTEQQRKESTEISSRPSSAALEENKDESEKVYQWPHGLCPPMRNVQNRRFRKTKKKKYMDAPDVEKELKRLLRADLEAVKIEWDIVSANSDKQKPSVGPFYSVVNPQNNEDFDGRSGFIAGDLSLSDSGDDEASLPSNR